MSTDVKPPLVRQRECARTCACVRVHTLPPEGGNCRGGRWSSEARSCPQSRRRGIAPAHGTLSRRSGGICLHGTPKSPGSLEGATTCRSALPQPVASFLTLTTPETETPPLLAPRCLGWGNGPGRAEQSRARCTKLTAATYPGAPVGHFPSPRLDAAS